MSDHQQLSNFIWQVADLLRGPYRPPQSERVMLPLTVLRRFDCVLASTKTEVLKGYTKWKDKPDAVRDPILNKIAGQNFHNHSEFSFEGTEDGTGGRKGGLKGDPDNIDKHLMSYINGFSQDIRDIFDRFEFTAEIEKMREANILYLVVSEFCHIDLHPDRVDNIQMGLLFEDLIRRFNELANETAGDHFTPREVIRLMVDLLFDPDDEMLTLCEQKFTYNNRGEMKHQPGDTAAETTIVRLGLNHNILIESRKATIQGTLGKTNNLSLKDAKQRLKQLESQTSMKLEPFSFVLIQALQKHVKRLEHIRTQKSKK
jgi:HsdM N-terminal domain/N-6 DNA Methylase